MSGHKRWKAGAWRLRVETGTDPLTGKRGQVHRTFHAPNTPAGERQADIALAKLVVEVEAGRAAAGTGITVDELVERYIRDKAPGWTPGAPDETRRRARQHISPHLGSIPAARLRPADVKHWQSKLRDGGLAEASVARVHVILQAALAYGVDDLEVIDRNVAARRKPKVPKSRRRAPGDDVMVALLRAAGDDMVCYLRLAAVTGARRGTLVALRWSDIDFEAPSITFTRALAKVKGGTVEKGTKADVDYRVTLDPATVVILKAQRRRAAEAAIAAGVSLRPDGFVFSRDVTPDGSKAWHPDGANQRFNRLRAKVPGAEGVKPHEFRHWMATAMFEDGFDPITVAGRGGWSSVALPLATYGHRRPSRDVAAAAALAERLDQTP